MAYIIADGPPDTDATHTWTPAVGDPPPVLNDRGNVVPAQLPYIKVVQITGWRTPPPIDNRNIPKTFGVGSKLVIPRYGPKRIVYECEVRAESREEVRNLLNACVWGFANDRDNQGLMSVEPFSGIGGPTWTFSAQVQDVVPDPQFTWSPHRVGKFRHGFTIEMEMLHPYFSTGGDDYL